MNAGRSDFRILILSRNRGELAEGWYDPETKSKADKSAITTDRIAQRSGRELPPPSSRGKREVSQTYPEVDQANNDNNEDDDDDDEYGPSLPSTGDKSLGPAIPRLQDLQHRDGNCALSYYS